MISKLKSGVNAWYYGVSSFRDAVSRTFLLILYCAFAAMLIGSALLLLGMFLVGLITSAPWIAIPVIVLTVMVFSGSTLAYRVYGPREDR